jgi:hypothetical protein
MARLMRRRVAITIATPAGPTLNGFSADVTEITDLRCRFKVKKTLGKEPNTAEVIVTNLAEKSRAALQDRGMRVTLAAGYEDTIATIFVGDSRDVDSALDGTDWITAIQLGDGERGYRHGRVSESFRAGTRVADVLKRVADGMQLDSTRVAEIAALRGRQYAAGYIVHGRSARELDRILRGLGLEWSIQDGELQILAPEAATAETAVVLDSTSGLIGSPTINTPEAASRSLNPFTASVETRRGKGRGTLKARSLLQPELRPGRRVEIDSLGVKGSFRLTAVEHSGDTAGGEFYSDIEGTPL